MINSLKDYSRSIKNLKSSHGWSKYVICLNCNWEILRDGIISLDKATNNKNLKKLYYNIGCFLGKMVKASEKS